MKGSAATTSTHRVQAPPEDGLGGEFVLVEKGLWSQRTSKSDGPGPLGVYSNWVWFKTENILPSLWTSKREMKHPGVPGASLLKVIQSQPYSLNCPTVLGGSSGITVDAVSTPVK